MNGQDYIQHYLDYLRELEREGPAALPAQDRRFVPSPQQLKPVETAIPEAPVKAAERPVREGIRRKPEEKYPWLEERLPVLGLAAEEVGMIPLQVLRGTQELGAGFGAGIQWLGNRLDNKLIKEAGKKLNEYYRGEAERIGQPESIVGKNVFDDPELLINPAYWITHTSQMAPSLIAALIPAVGAAKVIQIGGQALKLTPQLIARLSAFGAAVTGGTVGGAMEGAQTYQTLLDEGAPEDEAARAGELMTLFAGTLNAIGIRGILAKAGTDLRGKIIQKLGAAAWEGLTEAGEEPAEVSAKLLGKYLTGQELPGPEEIGDMFFESFKSALTVLGPAGLMGAGAATAVQRPEAMEPRIPPTPAPYEMERKYIPPTDLVDTISEEDSETVKAAIADAKEGTLTVDELEGIQNILAEKYPADSKLIQDLELAITQLSQLETEGISEGLVPVGVTGELARKSAEESARVMEEGLEQEEELRRSEAGQMLLGEQLAEEEEVAELEAREDVYAEYQTIAPDTDIGIDVAGVEVRKVSEIPEFPELEKLPEGVGPSAYTDGERIYVVEGLSPDEFASAIDEELEHIRTGEFPTLEEEYPDLVEEEEVEEAPKVEPTSEEIDLAAEEAETEPTEAQKEAGTYKKGHVKLHGFDISIENPRGSMRSGVGPTGKKWEQELKSHYGYIRGTKGKDKDHLDVFIGRTPESDKVFVVDQIVPETGKFDEHKIMMGFPTIQQARVGYLANYERGWKGLGNITELTVEEFREWTRGDTTKAIAGLAKIKAPIEEKPKKVVTGREVFPEPVFAYWFRKTAYYRFPTRITEEGRVEWLTAKADRLKAEGFEVPETPVWTAELDKEPPKPAKPKAKVTAKFTGWQLDPETGDHVALYDLTSGPNEGSTVTVEGLKREGVVGIPETPKKPPKGLPLEEQLAAERAKEEKPAPEAIEEAKEKIEEEEIPAEKGAAVIIAQSVQDNLEKNIPFGSKELFRIADQAYAGTMAEGKYSVKDAYDAMELGVNQFILANKPWFDPTIGKPTAVHTLKQRIEMLPTQTKRTEEFDEYQQFSTPPPLGYVANWVANLQKDDSYLEPSAGVGGIAVFGKLAGVKEIIVNELSPRRMELLKQLNFDRSFSEDAAQLNNILPKEVKPTVIVMNPPFSATAGRVKGRRQTLEGARHIRQALARLEPNGRLVAIVGKGMGPNEPAFTDWWKDVKQEYNVLANVRISGKEYKKYGTTFDNQLIVVDKTGPQSYNIVEGEVDAIEDLIPLLKGVRDARITPRERPLAKPVGEEALEEGEARRGPEYAVPPTVGEVGAREREGRIVEGRPAREPGKLAIRVEPGEGAEILAGRERGRARPVEGREEGLEERPAVPGRPAVRAPGQPPEREPARIPEAESAASRIEIEAKKKVAAGELTDAVYEDYKPERVKIPNAVKHPTPLVQSAAMAAVDPPKPTYRPKLPEKIIKAGNLSDIQLESIVYAGQAHEEVLPDGTRQGYMIGDGTGVGKGREIAGIIWDNWNQGRKKAVWLTEKATLFKDAQRDIKDTGWNPDLLFKIPKPGMPIKNKQGILFVTYDTLKLRPADKQSRLEQIVEWLGTDFDGVLAFDESHNMGNAVRVRAERGWKQPSQKALAGVDLQGQVKGSRKLYVSATAASEVRNLTYAQGLGLWGEGTQFPNAQDFNNEISTGGIAAMEMVARDMKAMGKYTARSLSYDGVTYEILQHKLTDKQKTSYNKLAEGWQVVLRNLNAALEETEQAEDGRARGAAMSKFYGSLQRFFNQVITAMKLPTMIKHMEAQLKDDHAAVIQLVNTLEASQERAFAKMTEEDTLEDLDLSPLDILMQYVERGFPTAQFEEYTDEHDNIRYRPVLDAEGNPVQNAEAVERREQLLDELGSLRRFMPDSPLDQIINHFGTDAVAEITGRSRRVVYDQEGKKIIERRSNSKVEADATAFNDDRKKTLLFSEKGGTGVSYHPDLKYKNQRIRDHYLLQAGWRADKVFQGLGRTHRSNEKQPPHYWLIKTDLAAEARFISSIARKLDQLGALTKGERKTGSTGIFSARDNLENDYARDGLVNFWSQLTDGEIEGLSVATYQEQTGLAIVDEYGTLLRDLPDMKRFLNRLAALNIDTQNLAFDALARNIDQIIETHLRAGTLDQGMETLRAQRIDKVDEQSIHIDPKTGAETKYVQLDLTKAVEFLTFDRVEHHDFYRNKKSGKIWSTGGVVHYTDALTGDIESYYPLQSPTFSMQTIDEADFPSTKWEKLPLKEAKTAWNKAIEEGPKTTTARRHLVTGALLPIWKRLRSHPRIMRLQTSEGEKMIGRLIPPGELAGTLRRLGAEAAKIEITPEQIHSQVLDQNYTITLANDWRIRRRKVSGEYRIEIEGPDYSDFEILQRHGVFSERIQWDTRYFIPVDKAGIATIENVIKTQPVSQVTAPEGEVRLAMEPALGAEPRGYEFSKRQRKDLATIGQLVPEWLKRAGAEKEVLKNITLQLKPFLDLRGVSPTLMEKTIADWGKEGGMKVPVAATAINSLHATVQLAINGQNLADLERLTYHEWYHIAKRWMLPQSDIGALRTHFKTEESEADSFADYMKSTKTIAKEPSLIKRLFLKFKRMITIIGNGLRGRGFNRPEDVFGAIRIRAYKPIRMAAKRGPMVSLAMRKLTAEEREWADNWIKEQVKPPEQQTAQVPEQKAEFKALPKEAAKPVEPSSFEEFKDDWFGNKDWGRQVFTVEAKRIQDTIMEVMDKKRYDKEAQDIDHAIHVYLDLKRNPDHLEEFYNELTPDQKKIVNLATKIEENPGFMHIADYLRTVYDQIGQQALSQNVIFNTIDNFVGRAWRIPKKMATDIMQKFKTTSRHAKHRVFETILEGWSKGYELEVTGASNNLELLRNEIGRTIEDKRLISKLRKLEWRNTGNPIIVHKQLKGYEEIKHPNFTYWVPEARIKHGDTKVYGPKFRVHTNWGAIKADKKRATKLFDNEGEARAWVRTQPDAGEFRIEKREYLWRREPLYAPEEIAKRLNKILGVSKLKGIGPIDTITKYNAVFKSTILLTSLFHHQAFIRSYLLGTRHKTMAQWNVFKMYKEGLKAVNELGPEIELLVRNGLTLGKMQDWEENILRQEDTIIGRVLDKTPYTKAFKEWANELRERQAKFLFQNFGAGLKAQAALIEYKNLLKENPDLEPNERAKIVADLINDDFGGLHLQRMERNPTVQHIFRLMALAPDWTESNVNTMWKAFRSGEAAKTHLYRRFWASVITKGLTAQIIANILLSFMDEEDFIERFKMAWKAGHFRWLDIDVTPIYRLFGGKSEARKYFGIFGHFRDPMKFIIHPIRSAKHKGSVFFRIFLEALTGTDWKGHRFTNISEILGYDDKGLYVRETEEHKLGEPKGGKLRLKTVTPLVGKKGPIGWRKIPSYMISQLRGITPVQVQNFIAWQQGQIEGFDAVGRSIGAHVGSTYPTERKQTQDFVDQWLAIKREGGSFAELRAKVADYNQRQTLRPAEDAVPISWSTIAKKGINIRKAEVAGERRKAVNE